MSVAEVIPPPAIRWNRPADALAFLRDARERLRDSRCGADELEPMLQSVGIALDQVLGEHGGMAEELLSAYEQLGIVFDVTRRLTGVQTEQEVVGLFLESLQRSFAGRRVFAAISRSPDEWSIEGRPLSEPLVAWIRLASESRRVLVEPVDADGTTFGMFDADEASAASNVQAMIGPIICGDVVTHAIVLLRSEAVPAFRRVDMLLLESLTTFCGDLIRNQHLIRELNDLSIAMVKSLVSAVDQKDPYTCGHSLRVAYFATELGKRIGLGVRDLRMLQWSALLHDVGKIGIRDGVLNKAGKLDADEFDHMKEHPIRSHQVVMDVPQLRGALDGILFHHEHYDGTGYPQGLAGEDIPLQARVIQIGDVFDALTSDRSYRRGHDWRKALSIMRDEAGRTIDPYLQNMFDQMIRSRLEEDENAWGRLVEEAGEFAHCDASQNLAGALAVESMQRITP